MEAKDFTTRWSQNRQVQLVDASSAKDFTRHTHEEFGVGLMMSGAQRSCSGRGIVEAVAGNIITVNPGEIHDGAPIAGARSWRMLYISRDLMGDLAADVRAGGSATLEFETPVLDDTRISTAFERAYTSLFNAQDPDEATQGLLELVGHLLKRDATLPIARPSSLLRVRSLIDDDPSETLTLSALAQEAGLSRFQLIRGFSRLTGLTPHAYILQRRLDSAKSMIRKGYPIADVSAAAGFSDQSHFHRNFTKRYGLTSGAYGAG